MLKEQRPTPPLNQTSLQALWPVQTKMPEKQWASTRGKQSNDSFFIPLDSSLLSPHTLGNNFQTTESLTFEVLTPFYNKNLKEITTEIIISNGNITDSLFS